MLHDVDLKVVWGEAQADHAESMALVSAWFDVHRDIRPTVLGELYLHRAVNPDTSFQDPGDAWPHWVEFGSGACGCSQRPPFQDLNQVFDLFGQNEAWGQVGFVQPHPADAADFFQFCFDEWRCVLAVEIRPGGCSLYCAKRLNFRGFCGHLPAKASWFDFQLFFQAYRHKRENVRSLKCGFHDAQAPRYCVRRHRLPVAAMQQLFFESRHPFDPVRHQIAVDTVP